eukprot:1774427-Alexandrium_andersonii.AAC.1
MGGLGHGNWMVGGDWNVDPRVLYGSGICQRLRAVIFCSSAAGPTCFSGSAANCLDYFLMGQDAYVS